ncbi:MAG: alpha/beta fold hydrolase [Thermoleophilaceae bacterium]|nr:alpha/beta fold hydrolase [Thermoleophilaceae bacterium]
MNAVSSVTRTDVRFDSDGDACGAWFYRPTGPGPFPVVVLCHGLGATREMGFDPYARAFAEAGIAALAFTYRGFGDSEGEPRQVLDIGKQREDIAAAIEYVKRLDDVDPDRVALFGSSFGGGHVIAVGADRDDIAAVVAQCPFTDGQASGLTLGAVSTVKVGAYAAADGVARLLGHKPVYASLAGTRGEAAMMTAPDVIEGYRALMPEGFEEDNRVAGRIGLDILFERPGRKMKDLKCPTLVCACEKDTVAPYGPTVKYAKEAPNVELKSYPFGHFDIYLGEGFEQASTDQVAFLKRVLKP